jgi:hypothetical protein
MARSVWKRRVGRMSTKQFDAATGFGYWGYRFYDP